MSTVYVDKAAGDSHDASPQSPVSASSSIVFDESLTSVESSGSSPSRDFASSTNKKSLRLKSAEAASIRHKPSWSDTNSSVTPPLLKGETGHAARPATAEANATVQPSSQTPIRHVSSQRRADVTAAAATSSCTSKAAAMNGSKKRDPATTERAETGNNSNTVTTNSSDFTRSGTAPTTPQRERFTEFIACGRHGINNHACAAPSHSPTTSSLHTSANATAAPAAAAAVDVQTSIPLSATEWAESIALSCLTCALCHRLVRDPVQVYPEPILACRACAEARHGTNRLNVQELPVNVIRAMREIVDRVELPGSGAGGVLRKIHSNELPEAVAAKRRVIHIKRGGYKEMDKEAAACVTNEGAKLDDANRTTSKANANAAQPSQRHVDVNATNLIALRSPANFTTTLPASTPTTTTTLSATAPPAAAAAAPKSDTEKDAKDHAGSTNEELTDGKEDETEHVVRVNNTRAQAAARAQDAAQRLLATLLQQLVEAELSERNQIVAAQLKSFSEIEKHARIRRPRTVSDGPTSRQLKIEADKLYESANYAQALQLYNKSIELQHTDQMTQLKFLYGNRSAANFMAHNYEACVEDCLEVVRLEPENKKMLSRAARASATMGDLAQAVRILESTTPRESMTEAAQAELTKYKQGLDILQKVEQHFGTPEADEQLRMLIAQFTDTVAFRIRHAESLMRQKQHLRALESLEVVSSSSRTATVAKLMAECLYMSGFEHFDRARKLLKDYTDADAACARLYELIERVENGKQTGNNNFAQKNFSAAVKCYTAAIQDSAQNDQILRILYCNRAAANKEIGRYRDGVEDCTRALAIDHDFFKAYARRARCHQHLGDYFAAVQDFKKALTFEANDHELAKELRTAEYQLARETEREKDYYYQLGVTRMATEREIKLKFRELSLRWHPDKCMGLSDSERARAEHKFKVISEAHTVLSDPVRRREFDTKLDRMRMGRGGYTASATSSFGTASEATFRGNKHRSGPGGFW